MSRLKEFLLYIAFALIVIPILFFTEIFSAKAEVLPDLSLLNQQYSPNSSHVLVYYQNGYYYATYTNANRIVGYTDSIYVNGNEFVDKKSNFYGIKKISFYTDWSDNEYRIYHQKRWNSQTDSWDILCDSLSSTPSFYCGYNIDVNQNDDFYIYALLKLQNVDVTFTANSKLNGEYRLGNVLSVNGWQHYADNRNVYFTLYPPTTNTDRNGVPVYQSNLYYINGSEWFYDLDYSFSGIQGASDVTLTGSFYRSSNLQRVLSQEDVTFDVSVGGVSCDFSKDNFYFICQNVNLSNNFAIRVNLVGTSSIAFHGNIDMEVNYLRYQISSVNLFYPNYNLDYYSSVLDYSSSSNVQLGKPDLMYGLDTFTWTNLTSVEAYQFENYFNSYLYRVTTPDLALNSVVFKYYTNVPRGTLRTDFIVTYKELYPDTKVYLSDGINAYYCNVTGIKSYQGVNYQYYVSCPSYNFTSDSFDIILSGNYNFAYNLGPYPFNDTNILFQSEDVYVGISNLLFYNTSVLPSPSPLPDDAYGNIMEKTLDELNGKLSTNDVISSLLLLPVTLIQRMLLFTDNSCQSIVLGNLLGTNLVMPCIHVDELLGVTLWGTIDVICCSLLLLHIRKRWISIWNNITNLRTGGNEVE